VSWRCLFFASIWPRDCKRCAFSQCASPPGVVGVRHTRNGRGSDLIARIFNAAPGLAILVDGDILAPDTMLFLLNEFGLWQFHFFRDRCPVLSKLLLDPLFHVGNFLGLFIAQALLVGVILLVAPFAVVGACLCVAVLPCLAVVGVLQTVRGVLARRDQGCSQHLRDAFNFLWLLGGMVTNAKVLKLVIFAATVIVQAVLALGVAYLLCCARVRWGADALVELNWEPSTAHIVSVLRYLTLSELFLHGFGFHPYAGMCGVCTVFTDSAPAIP
jgi:hypothetical protein